MPSRKPLRIPLEFDQALSDLLKVKPPDKPAKAPRRARKRTAKVKR